jgi:uncharacterized membrane protein
MLLFICTLAMVFLMAFQQQNVIHGHYKTAAVTSFLIGLAQFSLYKGVIVADYWGILEMGTGGAIGVTASMFLHRYMRRKQHA